MTAHPGDDLRPVIDERLVTALVGDQLPQWGALPVRAAEPQGNDNRTFRLGDELAVRLPSATGYSGQVVKEHAWLPQLSPHLPRAVPRPMVLGVPGRGYPFAWAVNAWLPGTPLSSAGDVDGTQLAVDLGEFLRTLHGLSAVDPDDGPPAGPDTFYRGSALDWYDEETRRALGDAAAGVDVRAAARVWDEALEAVWLGPRSWFHGDVAADNLLLQDGRLSAVLDFGCSGTGDPACDVAAAFTLFDGRRRQTFRSVLDVDPAMWARAKGWALWKALISLPGASAAQRRVHLRTLAAVSGP
jgi:aminoglycoside phosphotransferase (APT) family kinase protein